MHWNESKVWVSSDNWRSSVIDQKQSLLQVYHCNGVRTIWNVAGFYGGKICIVRSRGLFIFSSAYQRIAFLSLKIYCPSRFETRKSSIIFGKLFENWRFWICKTFQCKRSIDDIQLNILWQQCLYQSGNTSSAFIQSVIIGINHGVHLIILLSFTLYSSLAADVWACGVILFAMIFGNLPFDDSGSIQQLTQVRNHLAGSTVFQQENFASDTN